MPYNINNIIIFSFPVSDGQIQLILGPMFSGKSTELMRRLKRYQVAQYKVLIVKYAKVRLDTSHVQNLLRAKGMSIAD